VLGSAVPGSPDRQRSWRTAFLGETELRELLRSSHDRNIRTDGSFKFGADLVSGGAEPIRHANETDQVAAQNLPSWQSADEQLDHRGGGLDVQPVPGIEDIDVDVGRRRREPRAVILRERR
jgi:hypothetical protein